MMVDRDIIQELSSKIQILKDLDKILSDKSIRDKSEEIYSYFQDLLWDYADKQFHKWEG